MNILTGFKKITALLLAGMTVLSLAACGSSQTQSTASDGTEEPATALSDKDITIGVSIWSTEDALGSKCKQILDAAAEAVGVKVKYAEHGFTAGKVAASVKDLCTEGCQGIIVCNSQDSEMTSVINTCEENKVYAAQFMRSISQENSSEIYKQARQSAYYIGTVHEDESANGIKVVKMLLDKGCRDIGLIGWAEGDQAFLDRCAGIKSEIAAWNSEHPEDQAVLSEPQYSGLTSDGGKTAAKALISADEKLDGILVAGGGGSPFDGAAAAVAEAGLTGKVFVAGTDFPDDLGDLFTSGTAVGASGGTYRDALFAFLMVYNTLKNRYWTSKMDFYDVRVPYLNLTSADEFAEYTKYFSDALPYDASEIKSMSLLSETDMASKAALLSLDEVKSRHPSG